MTVPARLSNGRFASMGKGRTHRRKKIAAKKQTTHFVICLDSSGSMSSIREETIQAYNANVRAIRAAAKKENQDVTVSLYTFGEYSTTNTWYGQVIEKYYKEPLYALTELTHVTYHPQGGTPMLDCIGRAMERIGVKRVGDDQAVVVMVVTDGQENESKEFNWTDIKDRIAQATATDKWTFAFSVPSGDKTRLCQMLGLAPGNVQEWEATKQGSYEREMKTSGAIGSYMTMRSTGKTSTQGFFQTDMTQVDVKALKKQLTDVRNQCRVWTVLAECEIRQFVLDKGYTYKLGNAFYQLTKPETIQNHKNIVLIEKGTQAVYTGKEARDLLGLPDFHVKVFPGNHANWDIFVQSTSTNRKLVRGTKVVYFD